MHVQRKTQKYSITPMIAGVLLYNEKTKETLFRSPHNYERNVVMVFVQTFVNAPKSSFGSFFEHLNYVYTARGSMFICVITSFPPYIVQSLVKSYAENITASIFENLCLIDDTLNAFAFIPLPSSVAEQYLLMESQEEKLHDTIAKNREAEMSQRLQDIRRREIPSAIDVHLEKVRELELEIKKPQEHVVKKEARDIFRERKKKLVVDADIQVVMKERLKVTVDKDSNVKSCEIDGDLSMFLKNEEFRSCSLKINTTNELKYSPNLDRELAKEGFLKGVRGFPVNKNLALVKWKKIQIESLPISFTFWPSDLENGRFQIMFEICAEEVLQDLIFCFNKEKIKDVIIEEGNAEVKEFLEWNVGTLDKGQAETLEFSCACFSPSDVFPANLFFTGEFSSSPLSVDSVILENENLNFSFVNRCEVDSFVIVDE